jgi:DNA-directed RNA polymerase subunit F
LGEETPHRASRVHDEAHRIVAAVQAARERSEKLRSELDLLKQEARAARTDIGPDDEATLRALLAPAPDEPGGA